jgi:hypothetical protein
MMPGAVSEYVIGLQVFDGISLIAQGIGQSFKIMTESGSLGMYLESKSSLRVGDYCNLEIRLIP